jgi:hypothetical protein
LRICDQGKIVTHVCRISKGPDIGDLFDSVEAAASFASEHDLGRYDADELSVVPFACSKFTARA